MGNGLAMGKHTREKDSKIKKQEEGELSTASTSTIIYNSKMKSPLPNPITQTVIIREMTQIELNPNMYIQTEWPGLEQIMETSHSETFRAKILRLSFHFVCSTHGSAHSKTLLLMTCYVSCSNPLFACTSSTSFPLFRLP